MDGKPESSGIVWFWRLVRLVMGGILLFASFDKIRNPDQFAHVIFNYRLLPTEAVNAFALWLPWLEATVGLFLLLGLYEWASVTLYNALLFVFMGAIVLSLIRGLDISCGCFTTDPKAEKMTWLTFSRDVAILIPGVVAYFVLWRLRHPPWSGRR